MQASTLEEFFSQTNVLLLFFTLLACVINVFIGVSIFPKDKRRKGYKVHRRIFWAVVLFYGSFLISNRSQNSWFEYFVMFYFLGIVQWSRRVNVTLHAVIASLGMVFLGSIFAFSLF